MVANAITDKGVATATDATFETMANNISSIFTQQKKYKLTENLGSDIARTVQVSAIIPDWKNAIAEDFIPVLKKLDLGGYIGSIVGNSNITISYNNVTGVVTCSRSLYSGYSYTWYCVYDLYYLKGWSKSWIITYI